MHRNYTTPQAGSLWAVLLDNRGTSLFVSPICWTDLHTKLLSCRFRQLPEQKTPAPISSRLPRRSPRTSPQIVALCRDLDTLTSSETPCNMVKKNRALRDVMSTLFPIHLSKSRTCVELDLRFGGRYYPNAVLCQVLWEHSDVLFSSSISWTSNRSTSVPIASMDVNIASDAPILAYVNRSNLNKMRKKRLRMTRGRDGPDNGPVHRLQKIRANRLVPSNVNEDQYFLAVMIAMAQNSVYADNLEGINFSPKDVRVRLMTTSKNNDAFIVYTATVPAASLMMFHKPHKAPVGDAKILVDYIRVPIWPVMGLKERLGQVLGREVVGHFDQDNMETFDSQGRIAKA
ncbi:hypothetical protein PG999_004497 [Apiospora kogelbergensis]|uniref:Uncharacterized protein n=1 Tax=Apiospora kogelbergensis TaxID=1337665 RepID=A0AAW0QZJ4_9PEZI